MRFVKTPPAHAKRKRILDGKSLKTEDESLDWNNLLQLQLEMMSHSNEEEGDFGEIPNTLVGA